MDQLSYIRKNFFARFALRWAVSSLGLWVAEALLGNDHLKIGNGSWGTVLAAGLVLALVNAALKPLLVVLSFPAIILSLGLFMFVVNAATIMITSWLYTPLYVKNFGVAIVAGIIVSVVNFLVTKALEDI